MAIDQVLEITQEDSTFAKVFVPITAKDGTKSYCILREPDGDIGVKYRNKAFACRKYIGGKFSGFVGLADLEIWLVQQCLFLANEDRTFQESAPGVLKRVTETFVRGLPSKAISKLFERCKKISGLDEATSADQIEKQIAELDEQLRNLRPDTIADLDKRIAALQARRAEIVEAAGGEDAAAEGGDTPGGTDSPNASGSPQTSTTS